MELTSQVINEAEFSIVRRGYDPEQVDEFLEKLAVAVDKQGDELAGLRDLLAQAEARAVEAQRQLDEQPERVVDAGPVAVAADTEAEAGRAVEARTSELTAAAEAELATLQRTLLLAQKTADATVDEARAEAARMIAQAEADAKEAEASTRARLLAEIADLDANRQAIEGDVTALSSHLAARRRQLEAAIADLQRLVSDPAGLGEAPPPATSGVSAIAEAPDRSAEPEAAAAPTVGGEPGQEPEPGPGASPPPLATRSTADEGETGRSDAGEAPRLVTRDDVGASTRGGDEPDDDAWSAFAPEPEGLDDIDAGPPTQPVPSVGERGALDPPAGGDDAYLAELRRAMLEDDDGGGEPRWR